MIDLCVVVQKYPDCLSTRNRLSALLHDLYPTQKRDVNVVLAVYDCGVVAHISKMRSVDITRFRLFIKTIMEEYGLQEKAAAEGIVMWAKAFGLQPEKKNNYTVQESQNSYQDEAKNNPTHIIDSTHETVSVVTATNAYAMPNIISRSSASEFQVVQNSENEYVISKYRGFDKELIIIPSKINGVAIKGIDNKAFSGLQFIKRVEIEEGIESLGDSAFANCQNLSYISLPETINRINNHAFENTNITSIILPKGLEVLGKSVFRKCNYLTQIDLPSNLVYIPESTFEFCHSLKTINISANTRYICEYAFSNCTSLSINYFPKGITSIGSFAFNNCSSLTEIILPQKLASIHRSAFKGCNNLHTVIFPMSLLAIEENAFYGCNLYGVKLNEGLRSLGGFAFKHNKMLKKVLLPSTLSRVTPDSVYKSQDLVDRNTDTAPLFYCYSGTYAIEYARDMQYPIKDAIYY